MSLVLVNLVSDEEIPALLGTISNELKFLWDENKVDKSTQAKFALNEITGVEVLAKIEDTGMDP